MKIKLIVLAILSVTLVACKKKDKSKDSQKQKNEIVDKIKTLKYELNKDNTTIAFTAYKTTEKIAVLGRFVKFDLIENGKSDKIREALDGAKISIPINGIKTNDTSRDYKIMKFFFDKMEKTTALVGKLKLIDNEKASVDLTMNGVTKELGATYTLENDTFKLDALLDINNWNAQEPLKSLNEICKDLHKGKDGVSKTWSEVKISITTKF